MLRSYKLALLLLVTLAAAGCSDLPDTVKPTAAGSGAGSGASAGKGGGGSGGKNAQEDAGAEEDASS